MKMKSEIIPAILFILLVCVSTTKKEDELHGEKSVLRGYGEIPTFV